MQFSLHACPTELCNTKKIRLDFSLRSDNNTIRKGKQNEKVLFSTVFLHLTKELQAMQVSLLKL